MSLLQEFSRVSGRARCPICGKPDWCLIAKGDSESPDAVICTRVKSVSQWGEAGWFHRLREHRGPARIHSAASYVQLAGNSQALLSLARNSHRQGAMARRALAVRLGSTEPSLDALRVGWLASDANSDQWIREPGAWTVPMRDARGEVIGIRLRHPEGPRFAVRGSRNGLFFDPSLLKGGAERLYIAEGESDTAALLGLGLPAVGRPGCRGGVRHLRELVLHVRPSSIVIAADRDKPGVEGASDLATKLRLLVPDVSVIIPPEPYGDAREWVAGGAEAADLHERAASSSAEESAMAKGGSRE